MPLHVDENEGQEGQAPKGNPGPTRGAPRSNPAGEFIGDSTVSNERPPRSDEGDGGFRPSLRDLNRSIDRFMGRNSTGEVLSKTLTAFNKILRPGEGQSGGKLAEVQVHGLDSSEYRTDMSAAVISYDYVLGDKRFVFYYTFLLEGSVPPLAPLNVEYQHRRYENPRVAGDVLNDRYLDRVEEMLATNYGSKFTLEMVDAGANVIFTEVDLERDLGNVRSLLFYGTAAIQTVMERVLGGEARFNLDWLEQDDSLEVAVDFSGDQLYTAAGLPKRTDVKIVLTSNVKIPDEGIYREQLTVTGGMLEMVYSPPENDDRSSIKFGRQVSEETQHFYPLFTINTLDTLYKAITPELLFLGLGSAAVLSDNLYWVNAFTPRMTDGPDARDVGALALMIKKPGFDRHVDTKSANFDRQEFLAYFGTVCHRDIVYAMNIEERGDNSWVHSTMLQAAMGVKTERAKFFEIADYVTNDKFSKRYFDLGGVEADVIVDGDNRTLIGYYKDERGEMRDINDFDLLKWLNMNSKGDVELALDWQDTFDYLDQPIEVRLDQRIRILQDVLGTSAVKIKGYGRQVLFPWQTIEAAALAISDNGVKITRANTNHTYGNTRIRGNFNVGRLAGSNLGSDLFTSYARGNDRDPRGGRSIYTGRANRRSY